jgi:hypothetical protein
VADLAGRGHGRPIVTINLNLLIETALRAVRGSRSVADPLPIRYRP